MNLAEKFNESSNIKRIKELEKSYDKLYAKNLELIELLNEASTLISPKSLTSDGVVCLLKIKNILNLTEKR